MEEVMVTLTFDNGYITDCFVVGTFECENREYMALAPDDGTDDIYLYRYKQIDNENFELDEIATREEMARVAEEFTTLVEPDGDNVPLA